MEEKDEDDETTHDLQIHNEKCRHNAPGRTRTCGPLLSFQHQAFPDRPFQSWVCWLDYILDITVPTRIVSEDPRSKKLARFPADYPILMDCYSKLIEVPEALRASPHMGSST
jgi:hypothetical protein